MENTKRYKKLKFKNKSFMSVDQLDSLVNEFNPRKPRNERSYELEKMKVKLKDLQYFSKEDVDELRALNRDNWLYQLYFSGFYDLIPKAIVVLLSLALFVYFFGFIGLLAFLPSGLVFLFLLVSVRLFRGY
jgi:hypothetical protein